MSTMRPQKVFLSRTTNGLAATALKCKTILEERGCEVIEQKDFTASWRDVKGMLIDKLIDCDAAICLIGPACGMMMHEPVTALKDPRTEGRHFSYTQLELLVARDLPRPVFTYLCSGGELVTTCKPELREQDESQERFIEEFAKDGSNVRVSCDTFAKLEDDLRRISIPRTVSAGIPCNLPFSSLGELFVGRDEFITDLRQRLTSGSGAIIKSHAIHGIGGSGKTRTAVEYAWRHAREHTALLFVNADTPDSLLRDLAALCGPLILNLPAQSEKELEKQVHAALQWLENHDDWLLILDNVDSADAMQAAQNYLAKFRRGKLLITTRIDRIFGDLTPLNLDLLTPDASVELLTVWTRPDSRANDTERAAVKTLAGTLGGLALALRQAAAYITELDLTFTAYLRRYQENTSAALQWHDKSELKYPRELFITYQTSIAQLSPAARELQKCLAWFSHEPIPNFLIQHEAAPANAWRSLTELKNLHLAERHQNGETFSVHKVIQEITRQQQISLPAPSPLTAALHWVNAIIPGDPDDVRVWPIIEPLAAHGATIALSAANHQVPIPTTRLLIQLALFHKAKANYGSAELLNRRALTLDENAFGKDHPQVAIALNNLAQVLEETNRLAEAEPLFRRALAIDEVSLGNNHPHVATCLNNLGQLLQTTNRLAEAEQCFEKSVKILESEGGESLPNYATGLNNLATIYYSTGRYAQAEPLLRRALQITEASLGENHPQVASRLSNLAQLLQIRGHPNEAEPYMRRALEIYISTLGPEHPHVAVQMNNLSVLLYGINRVDEALQLLKRVVEVFEKIFGKDHPNVAGAINNLAQLLLSTNRIEEAEPLIIRALEIEKASLGSDHPRVATSLNNLGSLYYTSGRREEAERYMRHALAIDESSLGENHPDVARDLNNLGRLLLDSDHAQDAEPILNRALSIWENSLGKNHPMTANALLNLSLLFKGTNRMAEAQSHARRIVEVFVDFTVQTGQRHPHLEESIGNYAGLLEQMGDTEAQIGEKIGKLLEPLGRGE